MTVDFFTRYKAIVRRHRPIGYTIERRRMAALDGEARLIMTICINKDLEGPEALFILLHECGHVHMRHLKGKVTDERRKQAPWREEYEADQYAIKAMRHEGVPVPREMVQHHKQLIRELIEQSDGSEHVEDEVLKYAYGKLWRRHQ